MPSSSSSSSISFPSIRFGVHVQTSRPYECILYTFTLLRTVGPPRLAEHTRTLSLPLSLSLSLSLAPSLRVNVSVGIGTQANRLANKIMPRIPFHSDTLAHTPAIIQSYRLSLARGSFAVSYFISYTRPKCLSPFACDVHVAMRTPVDRSFAAYARKTKEMSNHPAAKLRSYKSIDTHAASAREFLLFDVFIIRLQHFDSSRLVVNTPSDLNN